MFTSIFITLIVVGVILWAVNSLIPMDPKIKSILNAVTVIFIILWLFNVTGLLTYLPFVKFH